MVKKKKDDEDENKETKKYEGSNFKTFKVPLKAVISHQRRITDIEEVVFKLNDLVVHTYQFIKLFILSKYKNEESIEITSEFVRYSIRVLGVCQGKGPNKDLFKELNSFYEEEYKGLVNHEKTNLKCMSPFTANIAVQIETCISNNIQQRFISHFRRFLNVFLKDYPKNEAMLVKNQLCFYEFEKINKKYRFLWPHLKKIMPDSIDLSKNLYYDLKAKPLYFIEGMIYMNSVLEKLGSKLFHVLPLRSAFTPKNIMFDTTSIASSFNDLHGEEQKTTIMKNIRKNMSKLWSKFLNLEHKVFKSTRYQFYHQIQTDGISCSLLFVRKDLANQGKVKAEEKEEFEFPEFEDLTKKQLIKVKPRLVACDPGKRNLVYLFDGKKRLQFTAPQRRFENKSKEFSRKILLARKRQRIKYRNRTPTVEQVESALGDYNSKTVDYKKFKKYLKIRSRVYKRLTNFYSKKKFRVMRLRTFIEGKRSVDNFINKIGKTFGKEAIIVYGNWSQPEQMKNFMPTLGIGLRREIHKKFHTFTINEAYTSKKCCECHKVLRHYVDDKSGEEIHRLLVCDECTSSKNKRIVFRDRDLNAATNILMLANYWCDHRERQASFIHSWSKFDTRTQVITT